MDNSNVLNRFFSKNSLSYFLDGKFPESLGTIITRCQLSSYNMTNYQLISEIYKFLNNEHRNEYFYKNTLLNELLVHHPNHSVENTSAIIELPVASSKLDFLLINGKAVVYEIKTELDNFDRLSHQITDYYTAFNNVVIVTSCTILDRLYTELKNYPFVGISVIDSNEKIVNIKEPVVFDDNLSSKTIFRILRKAEFEDILVTLKGELPQVSQFEYYRKCEESFCCLEMNEIYPLFLKKLKERTRIQKDIFFKIPDELKTIAYFSNLKSNDYIKLESFLKSYSMG